MTKLRCFWLLSDHKTVREISHEEMNKLRASDHEGGNHKFVMLWDTELYILHGKRSLWVKREQLEQVLGEKP